MRIGGERRVGSILLGGGGEGVEEEFIQSLHKHRQQLSNIRPSPNTH